MARREKFVNDAETTLNGALNSSSTSVTVTDGSVFPSEGDFRVIVGSEIMLVTARAANTLTVVRASEDTTAAAHTDLAAIRCIMSRDGLKTRLNDAIGLKHYQGGSNIGNRQPFRILDSSGTTLDATDFSWINQGSGTLTTEDNGTITATIPETTGNWRLLTKSIPTPPYALFAHLEFGTGQQFETGSPGTMGIGFRDSSTNRFEIAAVQLGDFIAMWRFTTTAIFSGDAATNYSHEFAWNSCWLKWVDDGVDISSYISHDGSRWHFFGRDARNVYVANPDQLIWAINPRGPADKTYHLNAWVEGSDSAPEQIFYEVQQTTINSDTGTTQDLSLASGETIKGATFTGARTATNDSAATGGHSVFSLISIDENETDYSQGGYSEDNQGTTDTQYMRQSAYACVQHSETGISPQARATTTASGDDLEISWTNHNTTADNLGGFVLFGGSGIRMEGWSGTPSASINNTYNVTGLAFAPDAMITIANRAVGLSGLQLQHHNSGLGFASRNGTQGSLWMADRDNVATTEVRNYISDSWVTSEANETGATQRGWEVTGWNSDGVTITARGAGSSYSHAWLFLNLGGAAYSDVRILDWPSSTGEQTFTFDFQPRLVIMAFCGATAVNSQTRQDAGMTIAFITADTQTCSSFMTEDNVATSSCYSIISDKAVKVPDPTDGSTLWEADFVEWTSSGMTLDFTTVGSASKAVAMGFQ